MKHISVNTYKKDKYYPRIVRAVENILAQSDVISPSEILIEMGNLSKKNYEAWRRGQVPYLERTIEGSLSKANRILRIIGFHAHDLNMVPRQTIYHQWGKGKNRVLRFSKSGDPNIEQSYSRHYAWNQSKEKKLKVIKRAKPERDVKYRQILKQRSIKMDDYEKWEQDCKKIKKANKGLLNEFEAWLKASGLSEKTTKKHLENVDFYLNEYLLYEDAIEAKDGSDDVGMFLGYWFIKKAMWASKSSIKSNATSLKKFYTFMHEKGLIKKEELTDLKQRIKEEMPEWLATLARYDDPSVEDVWLV